MCNKFIFSSAVICIVFISCRDRTKRNMMPGLANADSAAVMFYMTPDNPRFFTYVKEHDMNKLGAVINDANGKIIEAKKECATQGKIYFYGQKGMVDVVYFSNNDHCLTLSFIITGEKYFVNMSKKSDELLEKLKPIAKEPAGTN